MRSDGSAAPRALLLYRDLQARDCCVEVPREGGFLGRRQECVVRSTHPQVESWHAQLFPLSRGWHIRDRSAAGGTFVNEERVEERRLRHDDVIRCGTLQVRYVEPERGPNNAAGGPEAAAVEPTEVLRRQRPGAGAVLLALGGPALAAGGDSLLGGGVRAGWTAVAALVLAGALLRVRFRPSAAALGSVVLLQLAAGAALLLRPAETCAGTGRLFGNLVLCAMMVLWLGGGLREGRRS